MTFRLDYILKLDWVNVVEFLGRDGVNSCPILCEALLKFIVTDF